MQEEARLKQSLFEYRQKLTLLHWSEVTCVPVQGQAGSSSVSVLGSRCWLGTVPHVHCQDF